MKKSILTIIFSLLFCLLLAGCSQSGQSASQLQQEEPRQSDAISALTVKDGQLTTEDGQTIQLQGISTHGLSWFPQYVNHNMMQQTRDEWGCNVFRLAMYTADYNGYLAGDEQNKQDLKSLIDQAVNDAEPLACTLSREFQVLCKLKKLI